VRQTIFAADSVIAKKIKWGISAYRFSEVDFWFRPQATYIDGSFSVKNSVTNISRLFTLKMPKLNL
jgi:hypothetical protein